jgi:hypothetical protein
MIMIMIKTASKIVGMSSIVALSIVAFTIVALTAAPLATEAWAEADHASSPLTRSSERMPACHGHDGATLPRLPLSHSRLPAPSSYQCCLTGHDAALVPASYFVNTSAEVSRIAMQIEPAMTISELDRLEVSVVLPADPPGTTPLRI